MALPVPYFGYTKVGRTIILNNLSYNNPTSYKWDFGDGSDSTEKNPTHTYDEEGFYEISLTVENSEGVSEPLIMVLGVGNMPDTLNSTIPELVNHYIPELLRTQPSKEEIFSYINYWQSYLQPLVSEPFEVQAIDTHNELKWPGLVNVLISQLVAHSVLMSSLNKFLMANGGKGLEGNLETDTTTVPRQIKSIETGPGKTEWYEGKTEANTSEDFRNIARAYADLFQKDGPLTFLMGGICQLASRLLIFLPMCDNQSNATAGPLVIKANKRYPRGFSPFGYPKVKSQG